MTAIKPYFIILNCILLILAAYLGVKNAYTIASTGLKTVKPFINANKPENVQPNHFRKPLAHYQPITERNLFDVKSETAVNIEPVNIEALEQTELKLKLWGTVLGVPAEKSYAVIEDTKLRIQNLYQQGDMIQEASVKMILREKVILRVNDQDEILEMEEARDSGSAVLAAYSAPSSSPAVALPSSSQTVSLQRSDIDHALENVNELMQQVKVMPHFDNGRPEGFRLSGIKTDSLVRKMGLRNGDVITGVNGNTIQTMEDAMTFYQQLSGASSVSLQIKRRGKERNIDYQIK